MKDDEIGDFYIDPFSDEPIVKIKDDNNIKVDDEITKNDIDWLSKSFMVKTEDLSVENKVNRFKTDVSSKFVDTSLGGNVSLNVSPQFTRWCDVRNEGLLDSNKRARVNSLDHNIGMGEYYGKAIDDNSTNIYFEFGFPKFNNVLYYLFSSVDYKASVIANSGRSPLAYEFGKFTGTLALMMAFPVITLSALALKAIVGFAADMLGNTGRFDQYYLNPEMFLYWSTVNTIATLMFTELGIISPTFKDTGKDEERIGVPVKVSQEDLDNIKKLMPGLITKKNGINIQAMVTRGQRRYNQFRANRLKSLANIENVTMDKDKAYLYRIKDLKIHDDNESSETEDLWSKLDETLHKDKTFDKDKKPKGLKETIENLMSNDNKETISNVNKIYGTNDKKTYNRATREEDDKSWLTNYTETLTTVLNEGARYAVFRVEHIGSCTESFSNSTTEVGIGEKINSIGSTVRDMKFNLGGGEIPVVTDIVKNVIDLGVGLSDGLTLGFTNVLAGFIQGANLETNKRWDGSTASLPAHTFKMKLVSPSAHPVAQLQNLYIPTGSLLAGTLPLSTGPKSYTSPFLCNTFIRGIQRIDRGMITSLSITRGTSNLAYNKQRRSLAFDITFTVTDFSSVISAPTPTDLLSSGSVLYNDEAGLNRYIQTLCARDLFSTTHILDKAKIKFSRFQQSHNLIFTSEYLAAKTGDMVASSGLFSVISAFTDHKSVNYSELY